MNKRKLFTLAMTLCMIAILAVGGTLAYFTAEDELTNVFTAGDVSLKLDEEEVTQNKNGDYVSAGTGRKEDEQTYDLHPGITVLKDPTIHVDVNGMDAYVAAKITVTGKGLETLLDGAGDYLDITYDGIVSGGYASGKSSGGYTNYHGLDYVYNTDSCILYQDVSEAAEGKWTIYMFFKEPVTEDTDLVLFDTIKIPADYGNEEMAILNGMQIKVEAFATQTDTFSDAPGVGGACFQAMINAFSEQFPFTW